MMLPKQAPSVKRSVNRFAALPAGMNASIDIGSILKTALSVGSQLLPVISTLV